MYSSRFQNFWIRQTEPAILYYTYLYGPVRLRAVFANENCSSITYRLFLQLVTSELIIQLLSTQFPTLQQTTDINANTKFYQNIKMAPKISE